MASVELALVQNEKHDEKKRQRVLNSKILMPELWFLHTTLALLELYQHNEVSFQYHQLKLSYCKIESGDVQIDRRRTDRRMDGWSDGQTDDGEVIPTCHLCLQKVTQKVLVGGESESGFHFSFQSVLNVTHLVSKHTCIRF